jgi:hypothetical protein
VPGLIAIAANSDLIGTISATLLGLAGDRIETVKVREKMATTTTCLFVNRESMLTPVAARLVKLIKEEGRRFSLGAR